MVVAGSEVLLDTSESGSAGLSVRSWGLRIDTLRTGQAAGCTGLVVLEGKGSRARRVRKEVAGGKCEERERYTIAATKSAPLSYSSVPNGIEGKIWRKVELNPVSILLMH